jgi:uncharacterized protein YcbK (DUF882 family)
MTYSRNQGRRNFLRMGAALCVAAAMPAWGATARRLAFEHTHINEALDVTYWRDGAYDLQALAKVDRFLRDFRTDEIHPIEPALLDYLFDVQCTLQCDAPFAVISGYRSPATNHTLQQKSGGVATRSLHLEGRAIDVRLIGVKTKLLRSAAADLGRGGVGYYQASDFVHLDTGRFRQW